MRNSSNKFTFLIASIAIVFVLLLACTQVLYFAKYKNNKTFSRTVDLASFTGAWYQVLEEKTYSPFLMQKIFSILENVDEPCYNTTLNYTQKDGGFYLENECFIENRTRHFIKISGFATPVNKENTKFKIKFSPWYMMLVSFDYWIVDIDPTYSIAVLSSPYSRGITIISRTPSPNMKLYNRALAIAENLGYDLSKSVRSPHI